MSAGFDGERRETVLATAGVEVVSRPVRVRSGIWWCPFCGHSQMFPASQCARCAAEYTPDDGGRAVRVQAPSAGEMLAAARAASAVPTPPAAPPPPPESPSEPPARGRK